MSAVKRSALSWVLLTILVASDASGQSVSDNILDWGHYREIGPTRPGGRVVACAVSQQNPYVYYVGAGPGGVWKPVNHGTTFESIFAHEPAPLSASGQPGN